MKRKRIPLKYCVALLLWLASAPLSRAQYRDWIQQQEVSEFYGLPRPQYLRTDVEYEHDTLGSSGAPNQDLSRLYVMPRLGISWNNYIYHPYLLTYTMLFEPGYEWQNQTVNQQSTELNRLILDGTFRVRLLEAKPYATTLSYSQSHDQAKYGFFDTAIVDSQAWGVASGYRDGPVPVDVSLTQTHENDRDFTDTTLTDETFLNLHAHNDRERGNNTLLDYQFLQFDRTLKGSGYNVSDKNDGNFVSLSDMEYFDHSNLKSAAWLDAINSDASSSSDLNLAESYTVNHSGGLQSFYDYSLSQFSGNNVDALQNYAVAGIHHQLFESLATTVQIQGSQFSSSAPGSSYDYQSAGTTASADYTKCLGSWGHLYLDNSTSYNFTQQQTTGSQLQINNESHVVPTNCIVSLKEPRELAVLSVTASNSIPLQAGLDYTLIQNTDPWQIKINQTLGSKIQPGTTILVTYTVQANPSGNYSTFANQAQIRVTFFHDSLGVFARYTFSDNSASSTNLLVADDELFEAGADFTWHNLSLSGNYTDENSTFYRNRSYNLLEDYTMALSPRSSFGVDLTQQWNTTSSSGVGGLPALPQENSQFYNFMAHYEWHPAFRFNWNTEVGYQKATGFGLDQNLFAARTYVNWMVGNLQFNLGYEHENQQLPRETRAQDFVFLRARRDF